MSKIPVYFMPGLAASPTIFENIKLPEDQFEMHFWNGFCLMKRKYRKLRTTNDAENSA